MGLPNERLTIKMGNIVQCDTKAEAIRTNRCSESELEGKTLHLLTRMGDHKCLMKTSVEGKLTRFREYRPKYLFLTWCLYDTALTKFMV